MHATKPSSTKSPIVWQATLQPSRIYAVIYISCVVLALLALLLCPVSSLTRALLILVTTIGAALIYLPTRKKTTLAWCEDDTWHFEHDDKICTGVTASGSYRSLALIVVAIKPSNGRARHAVIWRDTVSPEIFSALHVRLALTSAKQLL